MIAQYFKNGTIRLIKESFTFSKNSVFRVWVFAENKWNFDKCIRAESFNEAYENYVNGKGEYKFVSTGIGLGKGRYFK